MRKKKTLADLEADYRALAQSLADTGFISRGSVYARQGGASGSRFQWSWKDPHQKTLSLTLSQEQYQWLRKAVAREQKLQKILSKMRQISQHIVLEHVPGPPRRKRLKLNTLRSI